MRIPKKAAEPLTILLVEDNLDHAELIRRSFQAHRIANRIHHVTDGEAALDYLYRRGSFADPASSPRPHLILLDLRLPRVGGIEVLKEIKTSETTRDIPVVILTTSEAERDRAMAYEHHANSYLVKPIGYEQFAELMEVLCCYWLGWNTPHE